MTLRERIALAVGVCGLAIAAAGLVARFGWWAGAVLVGVVLMGASLPLGSGDPAELAAGEDDDAASADPESEEWKMYQLRGVDDAGQVAHLEPHQQPGRGLR